MRVRDVIPLPKKKTAIVRETLVPKMIQFEGGRFDGIQ